jgi:hypothetical protein
VTLLEGEIAARRRDFGAAKKLMEAVQPVFTHKDAEVYQRHAFEALKAAVDGATSVANR